MAVNRKRQSSTRRPTAKSPPEKMRALRARRRAAGLRLVQKWVVDTRSPKFLAEARRQSLLVSGDPHENEIMDFIEAEADYSGWL